MAMTLIAKIVFFLKKKFLSCRYFCLFAQIKHLLATIVTYRFLHSCVGTQVFFCIFAKKYKTIMLRKNILFMVLLLGLALTARAQNKELSAAKKLVVGAVSINDNLLSPAQAFNGRSLLDQDVLYTRELRMLTTSWISCRATTL